MWTALWISLGIVFVAELGDKSQLMALAFATRYRPLPVVVGITLAAGVVQAGAVLLGSAIAGQLPQGPVNLAAGLAFLGFAAWTVRGDELDDPPVGRGVGSAVLATAGGFLLAELGDKTMLAAVTLATRYEPVGTWLGSTAGMVAADALAIVAGRQLAVRLSTRTTRLVAAALFVLFGALLIADALLG